jgi:hypothetical protein
MIQTNEQFQFLEYEYAEKLGSRNLTAESRKKLEEEFWVDAGTKSPMNVS